MAAAWLVKWNIHRRDSPIRGPLLRPHILPRRWSRERVLDYMRCLYWNSPLHDACSIQERINEPQPLGVHIDTTGTFLLYGDATNLMAFHVKDLRIQRNSDGIIVMEWTRPANLRLDARSGKLLPISQPKPERYECFRD